MAEKIMTVKGRAERRKRKAITARSDLVAGLTASVASTFLFYPLDTLKIRVQTSNDT